MVGDEATTLQGEEQLVTELPESDPGSVSPSFSLPGDGVWLPNSARWLRICPFSPSVCDLDEGGLVDGDEAVSLPES